MKSTTLIGLEGLELEDAVFQTIGAASMCWEQTPKGVFDSDRAKRLGEELITYVKERMGGVLELTTEES